jgi:hypothetical protein
MHKQVVHRMHSTVDKQHGQCCCMCGMLTTTVGDCVIHCRPAGLTYSDASVEDPLAVSAIAATSARQTADGSSTPLANANSDDTAVAADQGSADAVGNLVSLLARAAPAAGTGSAPPLQALSAGDDRALKKVCLGSFVWQQHSADGEGKALRETNRWPAHCSSLSNCGGSRDSSLLPKGREVVLCGLDKDDQEMVIAAGTLDYEVVSYGVG